jgi:hypothetical protein
MSLPFSEEQFLQVFADYNRAVWPAQLLLYSAAVIVVFLRARKRPHSDTLVATTLAPLWLWMGVVYHLLFFATINKAAYAFGALFVVEALLFFSLAVQKAALTFRLRADVYGACAAVLFTYALIVYPALGYLWGHVYPASPTFGLPCPTVIFTFGVLLCVEREVPTRLLLIPLAWSVMGMTAAASLGMTEDYGLTAAGLLGSALIAFRNRKLRAGNKILHSAAYR